MATQQQNTTANQRPPQNTAIAVRANAGAIQVMQDHALKGRLKNADDFIARIRQVEQLGFVCNPYTTTAIPEGYEPVEAVVLISPELSDKEVWKGFFCQGDEVALTKIGVNKIFDAIGATVLWSHRTDDGSDSAYCSWSVMIRVRDITGNTMDYPGSKEIDLRVVDSGAIKDGAETEKIRNQSHKENGDFDPAKFRRLHTQAREHIMSNCETKALLRAVRGKAGIRPTYKKAELARKPFYCYRLRWVPDMTNPRVVEMVAAAELGLANQLYGPDSGHIRPAELNPPPPMAELSSGNGSEATETAQTRDADGAIDITNLQEEEEQTTSTAEPEVPEGFGAPEPEQQSAIIVCSCNCGHQQEISQQISDYTQKHTDSDRCGACYPWSRSFNLAAHKDLPTLGLKRFPEMTPAEAEKYSAEERRKAAEKQARAQE
jgi:hypothetical protein